jgi:UDP-N-acetylmuramate-alanine ligase
LKNADVVLIPNIYAPIREQEKFRDKLSDEDFVDYLKKNNPEKEIIYTQSFENTVTELKKYDKDAVFIFASAGDLKQIFKLMDIENAY